jgi:uncharacterized caspase-like protein
VGRIIAGVVVAGVVAMPALAERRIALVIGNANYQGAPLRNPVNDARSMAEVLEDAGFEVRVQVNLTQAEMKRAIQDFGRRLDVAGDDAVGLFYFAGHGVQVDGTNYLIPVGASIAREPDVDIESVNASSVLSMMEYSKNKLNIVILDACRNNPFKRSFRSAAGGLARMDAPIGSLVAYATAPGSVAADGGGANGLYTEELVRAIRVPGRRIEEVFKTSRVAVLLRTEEQQVPWESSSLTGDFYFFPPKDGAVQPASLSPAETPAAAASDADEEAANRKWVVLAESEDTDALRAFVDAYPHSPLVVLARRRIEVLTKSQDREATTAKARPPATTSATKDDGGSTQAALARAPKGLTERARLQAELNRRLQTGLGSAPQAATNAPTLVDTETGTAVTGMQAQAISAQCSMFYEQLATANRVMGVHRSTAQVAVLQQQRSMCQRYGLSGQ